MTNPQGASNKMKTARMIGMLILAATAIYVTGTGLIDTMLSTPDYLVHIYTFKIQVLMGVSA